MLEAASSVSGVYDTKAKIMESHLCCFAASREGLACEDGRDAEGEVRGFGHLSRTVEVPLAAERDHRWTVLLLKVHPPSVSV